MEKNRLSKALNIILILGMLISLFLWYEHLSPSASKFCTFGQSFDCGIVNKSPYANIDGLSYLLTIDFSIPLPLIDISGINIFFDAVTSNAFLGFLTLLFIFLLNTKYKNKKFLWVSPEKNRRWMKGLLIFGVIYGFYLFLIQHFILKTYCIFCISLDAVLILSLILVLIRVKGKK
ncbi:MAG: vitamin K epoxide reductase family protein [Candidatus Pacearchaeota archaeon]|nr:vitamin K epoxide reductase family protein [Candidatus Pacearchaeota archaeon]